jgi:hypothetical protein
MTRHASARRDDPIAQQVSQVRGEGMGIETPHGQTRADRLVPLPENVSSLSVARRSWNGVTFDVISAQCTGRVAHHLCYESHTRLGALLEDDGKPCVRARRRAAGHEAIDRRRIEPASA